MKIKIHVLNVYDVRVYYVLFMYVYDHTDRKEMLYAKKKYENITNGIWINLIRKTNQCVFDLIRYIFFLLLSAFILLILCYFYVSFRVACVLYTHRSLLFLLSLRILLFCRPWLWLWLSSYSFYVATKRIHFETRSISWKMFWEMIFFYAEIFPRKYAVKIVAMI